jgi:hypothetical protein
MASASVALIVLGLATHLNHSAQRAPNTGPGIIAGVVVNEQREPVADGTGRDPQAVPILVSLLKDPDVNSTVPFWRTGVGRRRGQGRHREVAIIGVEYARRAVDVRPAGCSVPSVRPKAGAADRRPR